MPHQATSKRRLLGTLSLAGAVALLVVGDTFLKGKLTPLALLIFWICCLGLTGVAVATALLDIRALRRATRREQLDLFEKTLRGIEPHTDHNISKARGHTQPPQKLGDIQN